jgi:hypothetical protein
MLDYDLVKNKLTNYENELKYKDSIISYLESLLKNSKVSPNLFDESKYQENYETSTKKNKYELDESQYDFTHSYNNKYKKLEDEYDPKLKSSLTEVNYSKSYSIKNEIDNLDT